MKNRIITILWILLLGMTPFPVFADMFTPNHSCYKPSKPFQFSSRYELENFYNEVEEYKRCISDFVEEQNEAAQNHREASSDALDEWNNFVNYELD